MYVQTTSSTGTGTSPSASTSSTSASTSPGACAPKAVSSSTSTSATATNTAVGGVSPMTFGSLKYSRLSLIRAIARIFIVHCRSEVPNIQYLLALTHTCLIDFNVLGMHFLSEFLHYDLPVCSKLPIVKSLLAITLKLLPEKTISNQWKANILQNLITPLLYHYRYV